VEDPGYTKDLRARTYQIRRAGHFLLAISRFIHDREGFATPCSIKVFAIMEFCLLAIWNCVYRWFC